MNQLFENITTLPPRIISAFEHLRDLEVQMSSEELVNEYDRLQRDKDETKGLYDQLTAQYREMGGTITVENGGLTFTGPTINLDDTDTDDDTDDDIPDLVGDATFNDDLLAQLLRAMEGNGFQLTGFQIRRTLNEDIPQEVLDNLEPVMVGLTDEEMGKLEEIRVNKKVKEEIGVTDCAVCMDEFKSNQKIIKLPCSHYFHKKCGHTWLKDHKTCPCCREDVSVGVSEVNEID